MSKIGDAASRIADAYIKYQDRKRDAAKEQLKFHREIQKQQAEKEQEFDMFKRQREFEIQNPTAPEQSLIKYREAAAKKFSPGYKAEISPSGQKTLNELDVQRAYQLQSGFNPTQEEIQKVAPNILSKQVASPIGGQQVTLGQVKGGQELVPEMAKKPILEKAKQKTEAYEQFKRAGAQGYSSEDVKSIADAIVTGDQPPDLKGMYRMAAPVKAELARRGFDQTKALKEWNATSRMIQSLNSTQQVRLHQALDSVDLSIGELRRLSDEYSRTSLTPINYAKLKIDAASGNAKAIRYLGQLNLIKDELAQAFQGGGVPTESAFELANDILNPAYGNLPLNESLNQLSYNISVRRKAIENSLPTQIGGYVGQKPQERPMYSVGTKVEKGRKQWIVVGHDSDGEPLVEEA